MPSHAWRLAKRRDPAYASEIVRWLVCSLLVVSAVACGGGDDKPARYSEGGEVGAGGAGGVIGGNGGAAGSIAVEPPTPDTSCGFDTFVAVRDVPKLYVVVDRSGSMLDEIAGKEKYAATRAALVGLYETIGWKVDIGAALFPDKVDASGCGAGREVFPVGKGDPKPLSDATPQGPRTLSFAAALRTAPAGGTPTSATLTKLTPALLGLGRKTFVLLATDGGPNCNAAAACDASQCLPNIEGAEGCPPTFNCCAASKTFPDAGANCLDTSASVAAVASLAQAGVKTLVVGIPGSGPYAGVLDEMAVAGGVPRAATPRYYAVDQLDSLAAVLAQVTADVLVSCDLTLEKPAASPDLTNVYIDGKVLPQDAANGWTFSADDAVSLHGAACTELESGAITNIQVVVGCPTVHPP